MRAAYHLAFAVFSLGAIAVPSTAPNATDRTASGAPTQQHAIMDAVHNVTADPNPSLQTNQESPSASWIERGTSLGETLPDEIELYPISGHETYRYAIVNHHRVIVDATSRKVVYIVQ